MPPLVTHTTRLTSGAAKTTTFQRFLGNKPIKALWLSGDISAISGAGATLTPQVIHQWDTGAVPAPEQVGTPRTTVTAFAERFLNVGPDAMVRFLIEGTTPSITFTCIAAILYEDSDYGQGIIYT